MKIPKAIQRGDNWRICVNYKSNRYTSTHDTEKEAKEWAARKILELKDAGKSSKDEIPKHTYLEAIEYYLKILHERQLEQPLLQMHLAYYISPIFLLIFNKIALFTDLALICY